MNTFCVYVHTSPIGKSYVGQTSRYNKRCYEHKTYKGSGCPVFRNAIKKYGWDNFTHTVVDDNLSLSVANELEEFLIQEMNTIVPNGYNLRSGGMNSTHSIESIEKMRIAQSGKVVSDETRSKLRLAWQTRERIQLTPEQKYMRYAKMKGRTTPHEQIAKRKHTYRTKGIRNTVIMVDGVQYISICAASEQLGINKTTIRNRLTSINFSNYYYVNKVVPLVGAGTKVMVIVDGITYDSLSTACKKLSIHKSTLFARIKSTKFPQYQYYSD